MFNCKVTPEEGTVSMNRLRCVTNSYLLVQKLDTGNDFRLSIKHYRLYLLIRHMPSFMIKAHYKVY